MHDYFIGDPVRLSQMLINLVGNAIKFTQHGSVTVRCHITPQHPSNGEITQVKFEVVDTGIGIAPENIHKIFDSFTQESSETTRKFGGTGLGLAISKNLPNYNTERLKFTVNRKRNNFHCEYTLSCR